MISGADSAKVYEIQRFLGLNESRDGDTQLKMGEAAQMDNWRVTPQYHLRVRPGLETKVRFDGPLRGLWYGAVCGEFRLVCAANGKLYCLDGWEKTEIGTLDDAPVQFFGFSGKLYILNGSEYLVWNGTDQAQAVTGYVPLVATACAPAGGGQELQKINRLTAKRRVRFSADGTANVFVLPEQKLQAVDAVKVGTEEISAYTKDLIAGTVTFTTAPAAGLSNVEISYTAEKNLREQVTKMRFAETFNGATDTRVFLYGDGTNKAIYTGLQEDGQPTAEYFPDLYEIAVDAANTPITGMVKQYDRLLTFKPDGTFATEYTTVSLADSTQAAGFRTAPLNREIGNVAMGQVRLVYNDPRSLYAGNLYDWRFSSGTVRDERSAKLMSERVTRTLHAAKLQNAVCFDDEREQEYYVFLEDGTVLVHRYQYGGVGDVWYRYTGVAASCAVRCEDVVLLGLRDGRVCEFDERHLSDDGENIACRWDSGNMDFGADYMRKHSSVLWVSLKPDDQARLTITAQTDKKSVYTVKTAASMLSTFSPADFRHYSFLTNRNPRVQRVKLKVKKFTYYKLILKSDANAASTTVLGVDMRVRFTGNVK